jgi:hypothetical protein
MNIRWFVPPGMGETRWLEQLWVRDWTGPGPHAPEHEAEWRQVVTVWGKPTPPSNEEGGRDDAT